MNKKEKEAHSFISTWGNERLRRVVEQGEISGYNEIYQRVIREEYEKRFGRGITKVQVPKKDIEKIDKFSDETNERLNKILSKIKTIERKDTYRGIVSFGSPKGVLTTEILIPRDAPDPKKLILDKLQMLFPEYNREVLELHSVIRKAIDEELKNFRKWREGREKDFILSPHIQYALNVLQKGEVEFGGYIEGGKPEQELHIKEGTESSVCSIVPSYGGVSVHTHPHGSCYPSTGDILSFLTCPTSKSNVIVGDECIYVASKKDGDMFENLDIEDINEIFNALAEERNITYKRVGSSLAEFYCPKSEEECERMIKDLMLDFNEVMKAIGIESTIYDKNERIKLTRWSEDS